MNKNYIVIKVYILVFSFLTQLNLRILTHFYKSGENFEYWKFIYMFYIYKKYNKHPWYYTLKLLKVLSKHLTTYKPYI